MNLPEYAELHCLSNFTFLRGASRPEELVERANTLKYNSLAITDECSMAGVVLAHEAVKRLPPRYVGHTEVLLKLIIGTEITLEDGLKLVLLATDRKSYGHLCALITRGRMQAKKGSYRLTRADLNDGLPDCLALWVPGTQPEPDQARFVAKLFPCRAWIAIGLFNGPNDCARLSTLRELGKSTGLPLVAASSASE